MPHADHTQASSGQGTTAANDEVDQDDSNQQQHDDENDDGAADDTPEQETDQNPDEDENQPKDEQPADVPSSSYSEPQAPVHGVESQSGTSAIIETPSEEKDAATAGDDKKEDADAPNNEDQNRCVYIY